MNKKIRIRRKSQKQINKQIKFTFEQCTVCIDKFCNALIDGCQHQFCFQCIYKWAKKQNTCPVCRKQFQKIQSQSKIVKIQKNSIMSENQSIRSIRPPFQRIQQVRSLPMNFFYMPFQTQPFMRDNLNPFYNFSSYQTLNQPMMMNHSPMWSQFNPFVPNQSRFDSNFNYFPLNSFNNIQNYQHMENTINQVGIQNIQNISQNTQNPQINIQQGPIARSQFQ